MSQKIVKIPHVGPFKAFEFEQAVRAKKGSKQDRIHVLGYDGKKGKDPSAVAASRMDFSSDADAKLGWWDRKFCVLHKHEDIWYKININSFKKRIKPVNAMNIDENTGVCSNLKELIPVSNTSPAAVSQFKEMFVCKHRRMMWSFLKPGEPVRKDDPALADLLDYCENHESKIFTTFQSLALPLDFSQCKIRIDPSEIKITVPYDLLNGPFKLNWLHEHEYNSYTNKWEQCESVEFTYAPRKVDEDLSTEENFTFFMDDLAKTFKPWYECAKTIAEYGETDVFSNLILDSAPFKEFQLKDSFKPNFPESCFWLKVSLNENLDVKMNLSFYVQFSRDSSCYLNMDDMIFSSEPSFDALFDSWKEQFSPQLQQFLDEEAYNLRCERDWASRPFGNYFSIQPNSINFEFTELDDLLELNGEMKALENEQKYSELKELLNKKVLAELRKCHPDKVALLSLDPIATAERTQKLNDLRKKANDYLDSKI